MEKRRKNLILFIIALIVLMFLFIDYDSPTWIENWENYLGIVTGVFLVFSLLFSSSASEKE